VNGWRDALRAATVCLGLTAAGGRVAAQEAEPLADNSFLIEEAYNQNPGVVQEINAFTRSSGGADWVYTITQEWPVGGMRHQLSYTIDVEHHAPFHSTGFGDGLINYRYQAVGMRGGPVFVAPRLTAVLPIGRPASGRGSGAFGLQANLPVTVVLSPKISTHWNAGVTLLPSTESPTGAQATTTSLNAGASVIWLVRPLFNLIVEGVWLNDENVIGPGATERQTSAFVNPGFRWGFNLRGGLQIVTGVAYTVSLNDANPDGLFLYLSFEHPFRRLRE